MIGPSVIIIFIASTDESQEELNVTAPGTAVNVSEDGAVDVTAPFTGISVLASGHRMARA
jgi:hypothetical protein